MDRALGTKGNDIAFSESRIELKFSSSVAIEFVNRAEKDSHIGHNIVIIKGSVDDFIKHIQKTQYSLEEIRKYPETLAVTDPIQPGDSETIEFKPPGPGTYHYICTMPGHGDILGMRGDLILTE